MILVEGIAEELLLATMAKYIGHSLEDSHVAVINVEEDISATLQSYLTLPVHMLYLKK